MLRDAVVRLAFRHKNLRPFLLPLLVRRAKIVTPPRRGDRGKKVFLSRFLKRMQELQKELQKYRARIGKIDSYDLRTLFDELGVSSVAVLRDVVPNFDNKIRQLAFYAERFEDTSSYEGEHAQFFEAWDAVSREILDPQDPFSRRGSTEVGDALLVLAQGLKPGRLETTLEDAGLTWEPDYEEGLSPASIADLRSFSSIVSQIRKSMQEAKDRVQADKDITAGRHDLPTGAKKLETAYHASVNARKLYQEGFQKEVPQQEGLGGSQSAGKGQKGTSFTYDLYVAKEVSRTLKELTMIAKGSVGAREVLDWVGRAGILEEVWQDYADRETRRRYQAVMQGRKARILDAEDDEVVDPRKVIPTTVKVGVLYKAYLRHMQLKGKRYDPLVMNIGRVIKKLAQVNPRDIGVVVATINMEHPGVLHLRGERELRVPPDAIVSVDKFF